MKLTLVCSLLAATALFSASPLASQELFPVRLSPGDRIRLTAPGVLVKQGEFLGQANGLLDVRSGSQTWHVPAEEIETLDALQRSVAAGAWRGALAGSLTGAALGLLMLKPTCPEPCTRNDFGDPGRGALYGIGVGTAVGALFGLRWFRWHVLIE